MEVSTKFPSTPVITPTAREPDRQLSKKELKKKELAELDAVLAELGLNPKDEKGDFVLLFSGILFLYDGGGF